MALESRIAGRPHAVLVCAGNDGTGAKCRVLIVLVTGWRPRKAHPGITARRVGGEAGHRVVIWHVPISTPQGELGQLCSAEALTIGAL